MDPFDSLAASRRALEEGLALLDGAPHDDPEIPAAIGRIAASLASADDPVALRAALPDEDRERFDDEIEELMRLNAVLVSAVTRDREVLAERLGVAREARRVLRRQGGGESACAGARCDISG